MTRQRQSQVSQPHTLQSEPEPLILLTLHMHLGRLFSICGAKHRSFKTRACQHEASVTASNNLVILHYVHLFILTVQAGFHFQAHSRDVPHSVPWRMFANITKLQHNTQCSKTDSVCSRDFQHQNNLLKCCSQMHCVSRVEQENCQFVLFVLLVSHSQEHYVSTQCLKSEQQRYICADTEGSYACLILQNSRFPVHLPYVKKPEKYEGHKHYKIA